MAETLLTDIFTEPDDSIFSDGSLDPLGLRIIWTSMGQKIFGNRLNTVSTDIRLYTLNLFHHYIIQQSRKNNEDLVLNLVGAPPYNNEKDLWDGLIIFLESLMTHALLEVRQNMKEQDINLVPGMSKLSGQIYNDPNSRIAQRIEVNSGGGILVRHILLGIHGRHKGPFREMGIFDNNDYYANEIIWENASTLFKKQNWNELKNLLLKILKENVYSTRTVGSKFISVKRSDLPIAELSKKYLNCLKQEVFTDPSIINFWEKHLGLMEGTASLLYKELKSEIQKDKTISFRKIIKTAANAENTETSAQLHAICTVEPLLAGLDKIMNRLLLRGTGNIADVIDFVTQWMNTPFINTKEINQFLTEGYMDGTALDRLKKLVLIYENAETPEKFATAIAEYHKKLMEKRGVLPWLSLGTNGEIKLHRAYSFTDQQQETLKKQEWVNFYYLPTLYSLYNGLYKTE